MTSTPLTIAALALAAVVTSACDRNHESGATQKTGATPINPPLGLIGGGHPVGATGVRMALDAALQVGGAAGPTQIEGATAVQTLNLGGSATTIVSLVIGR